MDARNASNLNVKLEENLKNNDNDLDTPKISAYYSLVFPNFTYYLQTLTVTIGRRCIPSVSSSTAFTPVDVDLGPLKSVSRLHARIEYEEEEERFVLVVIGRNGAWVDGVWSGSGSRVPLSERSQIQIASRTFHFVLPPIVVPEPRSPSPSSQSSVNRQRSPSVDITSISPPSSLSSHSPPPIASPPPPPPKVLSRPEPQLPNSNAIGKPKAAPSKKRKKSELLARPKPEVMPPKPQLTYAQLCYRAIKALGGKATLQDICRWMMETFDWYLCNEGAGWENSVRHNLSSNRAFKKMERCGGERGRGFFWSVDEEHEHTLEEQEAKAAQAGTGAKGEKSKKKDKGSSLLEPPLKRSIKGDLKGTPLPPPLTSTPLVLKTSTPPVNDSTPTPGHIYPPHTYQQTNPSATFIKPEPTSTQPFLAPLTRPPPQPTWNGPMTATTSTAASTSTTPRPIPSESRSQVPQSSSAIHNLPPDVCLPLIVGPVPPSHPLATIPPTDPLASFLSTPPIVLNENTLILNPAIFSNLTPEQLKELQALGTRKTLEILQGYIKSFIKENKKFVGGVKRSRPKKPRTSGTAKGEKQGGAAPSRSSIKGNAPPAGPGPFTTTPLPPRNIRPSQAPESAVSTPGHTPAMSTVPASIDAKPPVPVPIDQTFSGRSASPIVIVDDFDPPADQEEPAAKRRRLDSPIIIDV